VAKSRQRRSPCRKQPWWWVIAGVTVALELVTGTFYLLLLAIGMAAAALAAHAGAGIIVQLLAAAVVGGGAVVAWYFIKKRRPGDPSARPTATRVNLDVGETVQIDSWAADGTAIVKYRGASWTAVHRKGITPSTGPTRSPSSSATAWWSTRSRN
jgi:membrane protein implicated in regulation of membrane protease activity